MLEANENESKHIRKMNHTPNKTSMTERLTSHIERHLVFPSPLYDSEARHKHTSEYYRSNNISTLGLQDLTGGVPSCALYDTVRSPLSRESFYLSKEGQIL